MKIRDIYAGKPDAKDEVNYCENIEDFKRSLIIPEQFDVNGLLQGDRCFVTGYKGTGKTALLFYLDMLLHDTDESACSSFIFFKEDFSDIKRTALDELSKRIVSSISISKDVLAGGTSYEYVWRWLLFRQICSDNEDNNGGLFEDDENWRAFSAILNQIKAPDERKHSIPIPDKIKLSVSQKLAAALEVKPEVELDLKNLRSDKAYQCFAAVIDEAAERFAAVRRTDIPYYVFIDELEAYYGEERIFSRDLMLIRDLVFTTRWFNTLFRKAGMKNTKIVCSVRSEILHAISCKVQTLEINRVIEGFQVPLMWSYTNTNSYKHPIIQILLKRIAISDPDFSLAEYRDGEAVYRRWFPEKINGIDPVNYILNSSWCKPRDVVRLIMAAQNSLAAGSETFSQAVFDAVRKEFSRSSLEEMREELRALYSADDISQIVSCFTGYKARFTYADLTERISRYYAGTVLETRLNSVIEDLYRIGFLGNYSPKTKKYRWNYKGDGDVILAEEWSLCIHRGLHPALSVEAVREEAPRPREPLHSGQVVQATVVSKRKNKLVVRIFHDGKSVGGAFPAERNWGGETVAYEYDKGDQLRVKLTRFNKKTESWDVKPVED